MKNRIVLLIATASLLSFSALAGNDPKVSLETLKTKLNKSGAPKLDGTVKVGDQDVPGLTFGTKKINLNYDSVDDVKKAHGGTATVFVKSGEEFFRVSTNVLKEGQRAIGTKLDHNDAYNKVIKGETFCGEVKILGNPYDTCYEPIKDGATVIGIYYVGYKKE